MKTYGVTIKSFNESLLHNIYKTLEEAEEAKRTLEAQMLGAKVEIDSWDDPKETS